MGGKKVYGVTDMGITKPPATGHLIDIPPLTYGIWIQQYGWLRDSNGRSFADPRPEYAKAALRMWSVGSDAPAKIELIDESMIGLQSIFLARESEFLEKQRNKNAIRNERSKNSILWRVWYGILGKFGK